MSFQKLKRATSTKPEFPIKCDREKISSQANRFPFQDTAFSFSASRFIFKRTAIATSTQRFVFKSTAIATSAQRFVSKRTAIATAAQRFVFNSIASEFKASSIHFYPLQSASSIPRFDFKRIGFKFPVCFFAHP